MLAAYLYLWMVFLFMSLYDGEMDLGRFTTFDLSRIDISKGASSVLYGANTMGGAVNLISKTN